MTTSTNIPPKIKPIKIFYSFSNHNDRVLDFKTKICTYFEENEPDIEIYDPDNNVNNASMCLDKIKSQIDNCDLFIADVTTDYCINENDNTIIRNKNDINAGYLPKLHPITNSNVCIELGYAMSKLHNNNIILLQNEIFFNKCIPSLLAGFYLEKYDSNDENSCDIIIKKIKEFIVNIKNDRQYDFLDYKLSKKALLTFKNLLDLNEIPNYYIIYDKCIDSNKYLVFYKNSNRRQINISKKILELKDKNIDLSYINYLFYELCHIETLIEIKKTKN